MVDLDLIPQRPETNLIRLPESAEIRRHLSYIYGPPGDSTLRRFKGRDADHWYLFDRRTGRAVGRISPEEWAKAVAGI